MKRFYATFADEDDADDARRALEDSGFEHEVPEFDNPIHDPTVRTPEIRGWKWGAAVGGLLGLVLLVAVDQYLLSIPRFAPIMTAGPFALAFLGLGLGAASGGFLGGVIGTFREFPEDDRPRVTVDAPDGRGEAARRTLREHGGRPVEAVTIRHEPPRPSQMSDGDSGDDSGVDNGVDNGDEDGGADADDSDETDRDGR